MYIHLNTKIHFNALPMKPSQNIDNLFILRTRQLVISISFQVCFDPLIFTTLVSNITDNNNCNISNIYSTNNLFD